jgi:hypothetical protein
MKSYDIFNHPKAKGVNFSLRVPNGWEYREGERPNVVKKFVWKTNVYLVLIKDFVTFVSKNTAKEWLSNEKDIQSFLFDSNNENKTELLRYKIVSIDKFPALETVSTRYIERLGINFKVFQKQWIIFYEDKMVLLQGDSYSFEDFKKFEPVYDIISASFVFPDQYK